MAAALVSIVIPCYNAERWIAAAIRSALEQTWPAIEIIVVNDGSRDGTLAAAQAIRSDRVRVLDQPNRGAAAARNAGLRRAAGEWIQFLDADDLLAPDKIALQIACLATSPVGSVAAGSWGRFTDDPRHALFTPEENWRDCEPIEWLALNFAGRGMMPPAAWLTPRRVTDQIGPWDERLTLNDDGEYFCRVLLASAGMRFVPAARVFYRSDLPHSLSRRRSAAAWQSAVLSHELCAEHLLAEENSERTRRACADLFQRLAYAMYPDCPSLVAQCEQRARDFGGSNEQPQGGRFFQLAARLFGWKSARRLEAWR